MSTTTLEFVFRLGGVLTDATAVVLSDPAGAWGVRRTDTLAVVVAAGTAMTRASAGLYRHTLADPAAGLTYQWSARVTHAGRTLHFPFTATGGGSAVDAGPSYLTVAEAAALAATVPAALAAAYLALPTDDARAAALAQATADVDQVRFQGRRLDPAQPLEFPRVPYPSGDSLVTDDRYGGRGVAVVRQTGRELYDVWDWDEATQTAVVPRTVKLATLYQAASLAGGTRDGRLDARHDGLASQAVGSVSESYRDPGRGGPAAVDGLCRRAAAQLAPYRVRSGRFL